MSSELPQDPQERELFLRALREYSERCQPPALTPDCPYSIETATPGVRACGEECMDLLGKHNAPRPSEERDLGQGLSIREVRRPRTRRIRHPSKKPYDAREVYLQDRASGSPERWRLAAILVGLSDLVQTLPPADPIKADARRADIEKLINLTRGRGLNFETQVLPSLRIHIGGTVFAHLLVFDNHKDTAAKVFAFDRTDGWLNLAKRHSEQPNPDRSLFMAVSSWALSATTGELFDWNPPVHPSFEAPPPRIDHIEDDAAWIYERFTITYLDKWSESSLCKEWLYLHGQCSAPCLPLEMSVREIPATDLALVMADKLASQDTVPRKPDQLSDSLVLPAINFLIEGRRMEAAALFEAAVHNDPDSVDALNNLGFCLLPDNPERALRYLEKAAATGHGDVELINVNRLLGLASVGRRTSALDLAATHLHRYANKGPRPQTWLWEIESVLRSNEPQLIKCYDLASYVIAIQEMINNETGTTL